MSMKAMRPDQPLRQFRKGKANLERGLGGEEQVDHIRT
jgi:hypothetical protein